MNPNPETNTHTGAVPNSSILFPEGFHAFLLENVTVLDPGSGTRMILKFPDGTLRRADVNPELLRLGDLNGSWRATLYFRTKSLSDKWCDLPPDNQTTRQLNKRQIIH